MVNPKAHNLSVTIYPTHIKMLDELALRLECSRAQVIRTLITSHYAHTVTHKPTCANGSQCLVPHLHNQPVPSTPGAPPEAT